MAEPRDRDDAIRLALRSDLGLDTTVIFRSVAELEAAINAAALGRVADERDVMRYVSFLSGQPVVQPVLALSSARDGWEVVGTTGLDVFVLNRRVNGRFGLPNNPIEKWFGVPAASRNVTTVRALVELGTRHAGGNAVVSKTGV